MLSAAEEPERATRRLKKAEGEVQSSDVESEDEPLLGNNRKRRSTQPTEAKPKAPPAPQPKARKLPTLRPAPRRRVPASQPLEVLFFVVCSTLVALSPHSLISFFLVWVG